MPDLDAPAIAGWLRAKGPEVMVLPVLGPVDDHPVSLRTTLALGQLLDRKLSADAVALSQRLRDPATLVNLRAALSQSGVARRLRLLAWFSDEGLPERQALFAGLTATGEDGEFLRRELQALHRRALLARIFAVERVEELLTACRPVGLTGAAP